MKHRFPAGVLALALASGALLAAQQPESVEVDSDAMQGRTEAAIADFRAAVELEPDLEHGAQLYGACAECHSADGRGSPDGRVPMIAGQHVSVLVKQLVDFRHDRRWHEEMQSVAETHALRGPQDLLDVAAHVASLRRAPPLAEGELRRMRPVLAGQHFRYLVRELEDTAAGRRPGMDEAHRRLIRALSPEERVGVADYVSRLSPHLTSTEQK